MNLHELVHTRLLVLRNIETLINQKHFRRLWRASSKKKKEEIFEAVNNFDKEAIYRWTLKHPDLDYGEMPITTLKEIARRLRIKNYSRLNKAALIMEIEDVKNQHEK